MELEVVFECISCFGGIKYSTCWDSISPEENWTSFCTVPHPMGEISKTKTKRERDSVFFLLSHWLAHDVLLLSKIHWQTRWVNSTISVSLLPQNSFQAIVQTITSVKVCILSQHPLSIVLHQVKFSSSPEHFCSYAIKLRPNHLPWSNS